MCEDLRFEYRMDVYIKCDNKFSEFYMDDM